MRSFRGYFVMSFFDYPLSLLSPWLLIHSHHRRMKQNQNGRLYPPSKNSFPSSNRVKNLVVEKRLTNSGPPSSSLESLPTSIQARRK